MKTTPRASTGSTTGPRWHDTPSGIGVIAHAVIAELVVLSDSTRDDLTERCLLAAAAYVRSNVRTARANATVAAGWANHYLRHFAPRGGGWEVLESEFDVGTGRVDLGYLHHPDGIVMFDEVKTGYAARTVLDQSWVEQANRYATAGRHTWGERFQGVRIVPLGSSNLTTLVRVGHQPVRLLPTPHDPLRAHP